MLLHKQVTEKVQTLPEPLLREVEDFIDFLLVRYHQTPIEQNDLAPETMTQLAVAGGAFDWLSDPAEDNIYTDEDGEPV